MLVAAVVLIPYLNSLGNPFVWDDSNAIVNNPTIRTLWPLWTPLQPPIETPVSTRPLVNLTFALNYALHGLDVRGYHVVNLGLHILTACFLFAIIAGSARVGSASRGTRPTETPPPADSASRGSWPTGTALLATLVWAVHPVLSEVMNYTTQRSDVLGGLFVVTTLYAAQRALDTNHRTRWQVMAVVASVCGMLSKEFVVVTPLIVILYDRAFAFSSFREGFTARKHLYAALAATWIPLALILALRPHSTIGFTAGVDPWTYALNQAQMIVHYLRLAIWPDALVLDYGVPRPLSLGDVWASAALIATLVAASLIVLFRWPRVGFLCVVFFVLLAPTSSIVPITTEVGAERRMYLPLATLSVLVIAGGAWLIARVAPRMPPRIGDRLPVAAVIAALVWVGALGVLTACRNDEFATPVTIWKSSVERWPDGRARISYAALADAGDHDSAIRQLQIAVPDYPKARSTLGRELMASGRYEEATRELSAFIAAEPRSDDQRPARILLASILLAHGSADDAATQYRELLRHDPNNAGWHVNLAQALGLTHRFDEAAAAYRQALAIEPRTVAAHTGLAAVSLETGKIDEAAAHANAALELDPRDAPSHNILGAALATQGRLDEAIVHFRQALTIEPNYAEARNNLARAVAALDGGRP